MKKSLKIIFLLIAYFSVIMFQSKLHAQETTGRLQGFIKDKEGIILEGAQVLLIDTSNGKKHQAISRKDGFYSFLQLPPASQYEIQVSYLGFKIFTEKPISISLGSTTLLSIELEEDDTGLEEVLVYTNRGDIFENPKKGNETSITSQTLSNIPTLNRSIQDATRLMPESNLNSFGGANYRFNNLSIDGLATNDVFGFQEPSSGAAGSSASGTPGGLAGTQPIGFGAIEELSVKIAPFDVTYGNFSGASINVVTKSGSNQIQGNLYGFGRNQWLLGNYAGGEKQQKDKFYDGQIGFSLGGPILKNKIFYFLNIEHAYNRQPLLNTPGTENSNFPRALLEQISDTLMVRYGYDPGKVQDVFIEKASTKYFLRFDFNLSEKHQLTIRNNTVKGFSDNLEWSQNFFNYSNQGFRHNTFVNSTQAELRSNLSPNISNKLTMGHTIVRDQRTFDGDVFPHLEITYNTANTIFAGTYREAAIYGLNVNTSQLTDNLSIYKGKNIFTIGGSAEVSEIQYNFLTAYNGRWQYPSVESFFLDRPSRVRGVFNTQNNDFEYNRYTPSAEYAIWLLGFYAQDEFRVNEKLNLQAGVRVDMQIHPGEFPLSEALKNNSEFSGFENSINTKPQINPRVSFDYRIGENTLLRGGSGFFTSRIPFLWYAYVYYNSGTVYNNIDVRPSEPLAIERDLSQLSTLQPGLTEINLIDNNFSLPRDWKSNIALDFRLPGNFELNLEATYAKVLTGLMFQSINRMDSLGNFSGADNRSYYLATGQSIKINENFTNVFLLTNTNEGYRYNLTAGINKKMDNYQGYIGYSYGVSKDIHSTVRSSHAANFEWNQALNSNNPALAFSNFDLRHKVITTHFINRQISKSQQISLGLIYNGRAGSPYSFVYEGDVSRDGSAKNDLIFIPQNRSDIKLTDIRGSNNEILINQETQWQQLNDYIESNPYLRKNRGQYAQRNAARTPWNHQIDVRASSKNIFFNNKSQLEVTLDIFNFGNLISRDWGKQHFVPNVQNSGFGLIDFVRIEENQPVFQFKNPQGTPWLIDPINSRWQMQLGLNYSF